MFTRSNFKGYWLLLILFVFFRDVNAQATIPVDLRVDLLENAEQVFIHGYYSGNHLMNDFGTNEDIQYPEIQNKRPLFSWSLNDSRPGVFQAAYRIIVSSSLDKLNKNEADIWDSEKLASGNSTSIQYSGSSLQPSKIYFWKVKTRNNLGEECPYSKPGAFQTAETLLDYATSRYPLQKNDVTPQEIKLINDGRYFIDFGKAAFGRLRLQLSSKAADTLVIHMGEVKTKDGNIDRDPGGSRRYRQTMLAVLPGRNTYTINISPDERNTGKNAIKMPSYTGEVLPFRYVEVEGYEHDLTKDMVPGSFFQ